MPGEPTTLFAEAVERDGHVVAVDVLGNDEPALALEGRLSLGSFALVEAQDGRARVVELLAAPEDPRARLYRILASHAVNPAFSRAVIDEVEHHLARPAIDDEALRDLTGAPFVTIDGPGTRDLDQALSISRRDGGYRVRYALADASYYVRPGSALFDEALRRGASYYLPGLSVPMLPRALSEGLISLNPGVDRRAMVFEMELDETGRCVRTRIERARIHSRAQLTFEQVQTFLDGDGSDPLVDPAVSESLRLLQEVGELRIRDAEERDVVRHRLSEVSVRLRDGSDVPFVAVSELRNRVELYNEQLSLLCNVEGARFLRKGDSEDDHVQPIYRVHEPPRDERLVEYEAMVTKLVELNALDEHWRWQRRDQSLADFLEGLPRKGANGRLARAIRRQAVMVNVRSQFASEPGGHYGIGADVYARFSAPMREIVGVFVHKETWEKLAGTEPPRAPGVPDDDTLRDAIVEQANRSKETQRELTRAVNLLVLDELLGNDAELPRDERPIHLGTVMGIAHGKVHIRLDAPPVDVKLYARHLPEPVEFDAPGVELRAGGEILSRLGQAIRVRVEGRDTGGRWILAVIAAA